MSSVDRYVKAFSELVKARAALPRDGWPSLTERTPHAPRYRSPVQPTTSVRVVKPFRWRETVERDGHVLPAGDAFTTAPGEVIEVTAHQLLDLMARGLVETVAGR